MHEIQKYILKKLTLSKLAKYSELKPRDVEGNLFSYHLKNLLKDGYLILRVGKYTLTPKGKRFVDKISLENFQERIQPKIVTLIVLKNKNKYLLYKRKKSPFINHIGFPYGKIHLEERIVDAATRELKEKTGLSAKLKHVGDVYITTHDETELISHMLCHVFKGSAYEGELLKDTTIGECFWSDIRDVAKIDLIPGVSQIVRLIEKNTTGLFFEEYFLNTTE